MIEKVLENIAYTFYPKGIDNYNEKEAYLNSIEYHNLSNTLKNMNNYKDYNSYKNILNRIRKLNLPEINDCTLINWEDRCISLEVNFLEKNILTKICINISFLIPFYAVYLLENNVETNPYRWKTNPKRNKVIENSLFKDKINVLSKIIEEETNFCKMQDSLMDKIIKDINFHDIEFGTFNIFNAFFLNENKFK